MSHTDATPPSPAMPDPQHLPDDPATLKRMILELLATLQEARQEREHLQERLHLLVQRLYGRRSERFNPNQPLLFADAHQPEEAPPATPADDTATTPSPRAWPQAAGAEPAS
jgi:transposase